MRTLKLTLQYDGTDFVGWQRQEAGRSVQGVLEEALARIEGRPVTVIGAGRTDAGVHALGQVASVRLTHAIELPALVRALNAMVPDDVRVTAAEEAAPDFHARFGARAKTYRYRIANCDVPAPFERRYAWWVASPLDLTAMLDAARALEGCHDFAAFQSTGGSRGRTTRTITELLLSRTSRAHAWYTPRGAGGDADSGAVLQLDVTGDGFLRHMVRAMVGTLVEVGLGRRAPESVAAALRSRDRSQAGPTAPAHGLFLVRVMY